MRMMVTVRIGAEAGTKGIKDGSMPKAIEAFIQQFKPESAYFTIDHGDRIAFFVIAMAEAAQMPAIAEPFFAGFNAHVEFRPAMNVDDLKAGLKLSH